MSAVEAQHRVVEAPIKIFEEQNDLKAAFDAGDLDRDVIVVVRFQGPKANGMPELHKLTPYLGVLQDRGYKVALVTDGRDDAHDDVADQVLVQIGIATTHFVDQADDPLVVRGVDGRRVLGVADDRGQAGAFLFSLCIFSITVFIAETIF